MPLPGPQFQALPEPADQLQMERPVEAPTAAPGGEAQPVVTSLQVSPLLTSAPLLMSAATFLLWLRINIRI